MARRQNALIVFEDESGVSLLPSVRATWAPRGQTPALHHRFVWKRLSIAGALVYEPDGSDAHLVFQLRPGAYNDETLIEFLTDLDHLERHRLGGLGLGPAALISQPPHDGVVRESARLAEHRATARILRTSIRPSRSGAA